MRLSRELITLAVTLILPVPLLLLATHAMALSSDWLLLAAALSIVAGAGLIWWYYRRIQLPVERLTTQLYQGKTQAAPSSSEAPTRTSKNRADLLETLHHAIEFFGRYQRIEATEKIEQQYQELGTQQAALNREHVVLIEERERLDALQTQLEDERWQQEVIRCSAQSLLRDFISSVNEDAEDVGTIAEHLAFLLSSPGRKSQPDTHALIDLIDDVLIRIAPASRLKNCRYHVVPAPSSPALIEINAQHFQETLFHLLVCHLCDCEAGETGLVPGYEDGRLVIRFEGKFNPGITVDMDESFIQYQASFANACLTFPARMSVPQSVSDSGLTALIITDSDVERRAIEGRLHRLGINCTSDFNSDPPDVCLVSDETSDAFRSVQNYLPDSTYVLLLNNRSQYTEPLWLQIADPLSQRALQEIMTDIAAVKDETDQKSILAVDDSEANMQLLDMQLRELGHKVSLANSGTEALTLVAENTYDLVFMDIQMPDMSGEETARRIRTFNKKLPIVGLTAHATAQEKTAYLDAGINDVIIKPVRMDNLKIVIRRLGRSVARPPLRIDAGNAIAIFDLDLALANANQRFDLAAELLDLLIAGLPNDQQGINDAASDQVALKKAVHKLHGAVRYCGVPRLTRAIEKLETALKERDEVQVPLLLNLLNGEITALIAWRRDHPDVLSPNSEASGR